ncbi:hypothetical protein MMC22_004771 [Lobaria immixta]|nr:hypothetical protein [Lobaria immixta]
MRIFNALFQHFFLSSRDNSVASSGPAALFQPIVTSSRAPLLECDYNFHKSNSTFFADLDVTRIHLLARLFGKGITKLRKTPHMVSGPDGVPAKGGKLMVILGGTHCSFRREIKPFQAYEMWSRVLAWDQKWIYIVTHFVKPGSAKPHAYTSNGFPPGKKNKTATPDKSATRNGTPATPAIPQDRVLASAISKYVLKLGRLTINPEVLLHASDLLPTTSAQEAPEARAWDAERVLREEREKGMEYARSFGALDGLHEIFATGGQGVLGVYRDL